VLLCDKKPLHEWEQWRHRRQCRSDLEILPWNKAESFAVIMDSKLINGLYICAVDFDVKNVTSEAIGKGKSILKQFRITQIEETVNGGRHWIYHSHVKPKTISSFHDEVALELLGEGKLCIMAPSRGYKRLNDNTPTIVQDIQALFCKTLQRIGVKSHSSHHIRRLTRTGLSTNPYHGREPSCIKGLMLGVKEGTRNETGIRIAGYLLNFRKMTQQKAWTVFNRWNKRNKPPLNPRELHVIFNSTLTGRYDFGCEDPLLNQFCDEESCVVFRRRMRTFKRSVAAL